MKKVVTAKEMKQIDTLATNSHCIEGLKLCLLYTSDAADE